MIVFESSYNLIFNNNVIRLNIFRILLVYFRIYVVFLCLCGSTFTGMYLKLVTYEKFMILFMFKLQLLF